MVSKKSRAVVRENKHRRLRNRFSGTAARPRLAVFRSNNHMYAQIIDDTVGKTLVSASTLDKEVKAECEKTNNVGRNFRFAALVVVGDGNGHVGAGVGKAAEIPEAIRKGKEDAIKHLVEVPIDENGSVPHDFIGKFGGATVLLKRAPEGTGIIAGGPARSVLELVGIKNIRTKSLGSNNKQNVVLATIAGLQAMKTPEEVARLRGKSVEEILG